MKNKKIQVSGGKKYLENFGAAAFYQLRDWANKNVSSTTHIIYIPSQHGNITFIRYLDNSYYIGMTEESEKIAGECHLRMTEYYRQKNK